MKKIISLCAFCISAAICVAQKETFGITTFTPPKGWKKEVSESALQFTKEDTIKGVYCLITLYKAVPGTTNAKENFDLAWATVVKEMVTVSVAPEMQPAATENGWEMQSGYAPFEKEGEKGIAVLVTASDYDKMVNLLILTNTDAYEKDMTSFIESISLKKQTQTTNKPSPASEKTVQAISAAKKDGFAFTTTNFDDGWTSTVQEDWVEVVKNNSKVLIHYPKEGTIFPADPEPLTNAAWNILVAPRYSNLRNYMTTYISTYNRPYLGMGTATDNATGKDVFIVLYRQGETGWLEFISPDKNSFIQQYKFDPEIIRWDSETDLLKPLEKMVNYNKFAVAASDFTGAWTSDFTGVQQLYNVYTGNYAGMNVHQSSQEFVFGAGNSYNWRLLVVSGMVGNTKYQEVKSSGKFSVPNNWQIHFSKIESGAKTYHAHWSCIKGARLLKLLDAKSPGSGIYDVYGKK
ncbi:hypothetical protein [Terrimonas pollutisoli]|uniref:hypothetical protein n=1 Tax=Terrimonas pollutisoli TaxID=3034147 RepID=UPI0023EB8553|nr:hypothetical protein [Terrimonas sp. H1YJ31]